jgi:hypothetical protein
MRAAWTKRQQRLSGWRRNGVGLRHGGRSRRLPRNDEYAPRAGNGSIGSGLAAP